MDLRKARKDEILRVALNGLAEVNAEKQRGRSSFIAFPKGRHSGLPTPRWRTFTVATATPKNLRLDWKARCDAVTAGSF